MRALFSFRMAYLIVGLISSAAFAEMPGPVQFKNGNDIEIEELSGSVTYYCTDTQGHNYTRHWFCNADLVSPGTHDYLISKTPIDADKVTLTSTRPDGKVRTKSSSYNSEKSISKSRFNLLIRTLTQSPLLGVGNNSVAYKFTKGKTVVEEGLFNAKATVVGKIQCKPRTTFANMDSYCESQNMGCDNYFYLENNCQY